LLWPNDFAATFAARLPCPHPYFLLPEMTGSDSFQKSIIKARLFPGMRKLWLL
jgi:hypothetical protein